MDSNDIKEVIDGWFINSTRDDADIARLYAIIYLCIEENIEKYLGNSYSKSKYK